jgi:hypothetical protein
MKTKLFLALAAFALTFAACQKENDDTENGGTTEEDYQPTSAGSTWQYSSTTSGDYTETATETHKTIEGDDFVAFALSSGDTTFISKNNNTYKSYSYFEEIQEYLKLTYLKDADAGTTWEDVVNYEYNGVSIPITFKYTITSRDGDKVINNKTYNNVIAVDTKISASSLIVGGDGTIATGERLYAKGVGAISSTLHFSALGTTVSDSTYLVSYDIK